jgi:hypothetical protein
MEYAGAMMKAPQVVRTGVESLKKESLDATAKPASLL